MSDKVTLSARVRPGSEVADWVWDEIKSLEQRLDEATAERDRALGGERLRTEDALEAAQDLYRAVEENKKLRRQLDTYRKQRTDQLLERVSTLKSELREAQDAYKRQLTENNILVELLYNREVYAEVTKAKQPEEQPAQEEDCQACPEAEDGTHCSHWWEGDRCCYCGSDEGQIDGDDGTC
jgi:hypothetical protein